MHASQAPCCCIDVAVQSQGLLVISIEQERESLRYGDQVVVLCQRFWFFSQLCMLLSLHHCLIEDVLKTRLLVCVCMCVCCGSECDVDKC